MTLKILTREVNGVKIIDLSGRLILGDASVSIRNEVRKEIGNGFRRIYLISARSPTFIAPAWAS